MKKLLYIILGLISLPFIVMAFNVTVPLAPAADYLLLSTTSGQYLTISSSTFQTLLTNPVTGTGTNGKTARWTSASAIGAGILFDNGTVAGVNATTSTSTFNIQGNAGVNPFQIASSTGTNLFTVTQAGNVGIGTSTPATTLDVNGSVTARSGTKSILLAGGSGANMLISVPSGGNLELFNTNTSATVSGFNTTQDLKLTGTGGTGIKFGSGTGGATYNMIINYNGTNLIIDPQVIGSGATIFKNGNIGVGTSSPSAMLDIYGTSSAPTTDLFGISSSSNSRLFTITSAGNVGIGTTSPAFPLVVTGNTPFEIDSTGRIILRSSSTNNWVVLQNSSDSFFIGDKNTNFFQFSTTGLIPATDNSAASQIGSASKRIENIYVATTGFFGTTTSSNRLQITGSPTVDSFDISSTSGSSLFHVTQAGNVGIGTTTPATMLDIYGTGNNNLFQIASSTNTIYYKLDKKGHETTASSTEITPTLSSCGTSPIIAAGSNDRWGEITAGASANGCTVTFKQPYTNAPSCIVTDETTSLVNALSYTESNTALTVTQTGIGGGIFDYSCHGMNE